MSKATGRNWSGQGKESGKAEEPLRILRESLKARMQAGILEFIEALFEEQRQELIGPAWSRKTPEQARSGGSERGSIYLEGRRMPVSYPRVADEQGSCALPAYTALRSYDLMAEEVQAKLVRGISTRDYRDVVTQIADGTRLSKTTVSRAFIKASQKSLDQINGRDLSKQEFIGLFIDGISFGEVLIVAALGVDREGQKVVLGLQEGHTENATVVSALLDNLQERGLVLAEKFLAVIDGAKALRAALLRRWQGRVVIARCQVHKKRNVLEHLPPKYHGDIRRRMSVAYGMQDYEEALRLLQKTVEHLRQINQDAAASLEEGMEETLTVVKLGLPELLRKTFSTTNPVESVFDGIRSRTRRVKRWRKSNQMVMRWTAATALETERRFYKIKGHKLLNLLAAALEGKKLDGMKEVG